MDSTNIFNYMHKYEGTRLQTHQIDTAQTLRNLFVFNLSADLLL